MPQARRREANDGSARRDQSADLRDQSADLKSSVRGIEATCRVHFCKTPGASALIVRTFVVAVILVLALSGVLSSARAQSSPALQPAATSPAKPTAKSATKKARTSATPSTPAESGPCQIGVIPAIGDQFVVQKVGLTVFGNEETEIPVPAWNLDDLVVARVRAAAPGLRVRKLSYAKEAFDPYYHPPSRLFGDPRHDLTNIVRQIAAGVHCERYVAVTKFDGQFGGTNQTLRGIGAVSHGIGALTSAALFANVNATVFDGQTFDIVKRPMPGLGAILSAGLVQDPLTQLDNADFPTAPADAAASATLRDHTRALIAANLDKILPAYLKPEQ
jgi:hypothetical protein